MALRIPSACIMLRRAKSQQKKNLCSAKTKAIGAAVDALFSSKSKVRILRTHWSVCEMYVKVTHRRCENVLA